MSDGRTNPIGRRGVVIGAAAAATAAVVAACGGPVTRTARPRRSPGGRRDTMAATPTRSSPTPAPPHGPATQVGHGPRSGHDVALTFHTAGDPAVVDSVLAAAHRAGAHLTMLVVGTWLAQHRGFAGRILAAGHDLGNHTWTHPVLADDDARQTRTEIVRCRDLLTTLTGSGGRWFRPSGTQVATPLMLREAGAAGYPTVLSYDVDPLDYTDPGPAAVTQRVLGAVGPGSVVSLHTLYAGTAQALPQIFHGLRDRGLRAVTASQLLAKTV